MILIWNEAISELHKMSAAQTPRKKILLVGRAIEIIQHSFDMFKFGQSICADDIVNILPYLVSKARI